MRTKTNFPREIREIEHINIPLSDGTRLAARIWLPLDAEDRPVPAILEYIPYRKRENTAARDVRHHPYIAGHGYACCRVDLRGSGESEGVLEDEYLQQELDDGIEVIQWLASQRWCNGNVGMIGISWGGFNGLQIAALQPPALKAVVTICSTDDRYADDIHYMGGCLLGDNLSWASVMFDHNTHPPDPLLVGDKWRSMWMQRLEGSGLWLEKWLRHQRRDAYWKHGSVCENYQSIQCPILAVSGWADGYTNTVFRLLENLEVPTKGLVGPWSHKYPHEGRPGPAIGFLQETLHWWDRWLKGIENGVESGPALKAYMQESVPPASSYEFRPGRWVAEDHWPSRNISPLYFSIRKGVLVEKDKIEKNSESSEPLTFTSPLSVGLHGGKWCSYLSPPDLPTDQRADDGGSLTFETEPLKETIEILGRPVLHARISSDRPVAMLAVRLSDLRPDGSIGRVSYGLLNLTHHSDHEHPEALVPGEIYHVTIPLNHIAQQFSPGHRIRLALSSSYWPLAWPSPQPVRLTLYPAKTVLELPKRPRRQDEPTVEFEPAEGAAPLDFTNVEEGISEWKVEQDLVHDLTEVKIVNDGGMVRHNAIDMEVGFRSEETYSHRGNDYDSVKARTKWTRTFRREGWEVYTETVSELRSDAGNFFIKAILRAKENGREVFSQSWEHKIPRDLV